MNTMLINDTEEMLMLGDDVPKLTLKQVRVRKLMSANELGKLAHIAASTILDIESGSTPRLSTIRKLSAALDITPTDIAWPGDPLREGEQQEGEDAE